MRERQLFRLLKFALFIGFIKSMNFYLFWYINSGFFYLFIFLILLLMLNKYPYVFYANRKHHYWLIFLFFIKEVFAYDAFESIEKCISCIIYALIVFILLFMKNVYKYSILHCFTKNLAIIILLSLPLYFIILLIGYLPSLGQITYEGAASIYKYYNYGILLINDFYHYRFHSVFCEPGHLGMVISLLLYINKFDFRDKFVVILFIGLCFTFSLAAYVLCGLGFLLIKIQNKVSILNVLTLSISCFIVFYMVRSYNDGRNLVNELIIERLEFDEERGISGNNRINYGARMSFINLTSSELFWGIGKQATEDLDAFGPGFQVFIMRYGIISYIIIFLFYLLTGMRTINKKEVFGYIFLFFLLLLQRSYPFWMAFVFTYIVTAKIKCNENSNNKFSILAKH